MKQYYYLVSTLPLLLYDSDDFIGTEDFLERCRSWLSKDDIQIIENTALDLSLRPLADEEFINSWYQWESSVRNELCKLRSARKGVDPTEFLRDVPELLGTETIAREAFTQDSPAFGEEILNRARWQFLEQVEIGHYFDIIKLFVYFLKLQILDKKKKMTYENGLTAFNEIYETITKNIQDLQLSRSM